MCKVNKNQRYEINKCLKHPWITRNADQGLPVTMMESYIKRDIIKNAKNVKIIK